MRFTATRPAALVRPRTAAATLLDRRGTVYLPDPDDAGAGPVDLRTRARLARRGSSPDAVVAAGVILLEADLLERGLLISADLRERLSRMEIESLQVHGAALLADIDAALGADRPMVPLFRGFPRSVPRDTGAAWVDRVLTLLFQEPQQPCVLCGAIGAVNAVAPCAHLVCSNCFDGADYSACPICNRRINLDDPFLLPSAPTRTGRTLAMPRRARVITIGLDATADAYEEVAVLLARTAAPSPDDTADLQALLQLHDRDNLAWLPATIAARETRAIVLAWLLEETAAWPAALPVVVEHIGTATDALRLLAVRGGGDPGLVSVPRFGPVPRPLRRALLSALDRLDPRTLAEDLGRNRRMWISAAERLHPFEHARRYPTATAAFAALRGTPLTGDGFSAQLRATARQHGLEVTQTAKGFSRLTAAGFAGRVERRLAEGDVAGATRLLSNRPGEFLRRLDHLLRLASGPPDTTPDTPPATESAAAAARVVLGALPGAAAQVSPAVLISTLGQLRTRAARARRRVFFPKGGNAKSHVVPDDRPALPRGVVDEATAILTAEVLSRCGRLPTVDVAVVDRALHGLIAPFTQRTASRALVTLPRGSALELPLGRYLRLFLHWTEGERRVDIDLSAAFFDAAWQHLGTCDYTSLRWADDAAIHSGDLTSAPPPLGASEFLDLNLESVSRAGARYVVSAVLSYNNVAFVDMPEAFAGVMLRDDEPDENAIFEPRAVEQRFDLAGRARVCVPFVLDLQARTLRWLDVVQGVTGTDHAVHRHSHHLATLGEALTELYGSGARVSLGELAVWHAAARAGTVLVRGDEDSVSRYTRHAGETAASFVARILAGETDEPTATAAAEPAGLGFLLRGDVALLAGAEAYALYPDALAAGQVRRLAADDLAALLTPDGTAAQQPSVSSTAASPRAGPREGRRCSR